MLLLAVAKVLRQGHPPGVAADRVAAAAIKARGLRDDTSCIVCMLGSPVATSSPAGGRGFSPFNRARKSRSGNVLDRSGYGPDDSGFSVASSGSSDSLGVGDDPENTPPGDSPVPAPSPTPNPPPPFVLPSPAAPAGTCARRAAS